MAKYNWQDIMDTHFMNDGTISELCEECYQMGMRDACHIKGGEVFADSYIKGLHDGKDAAMALPSTQELLKRAEQKGREDAVSEAESKIKAYASVWMEYTDSMSKEEIAQEALDSAKSAMIQILEQMKEKKDE